MYSRKNKGYSKRNRRNRGYKKGGQSSLIEGQLEKGEKPNITRKLKHMNCSPFSKKKRTMKHSCFTPESLILLKNAYNKHHEKDPSKQIKTDDAREIWEQLNVRLSHCEKETCWLNQINDVNIKKKMEELLFAPLQPMEWRKDKNTWLTNFDILEVLEQYELAYPNFLFLGPTPIDFDKKVKENGETRKKCIWEEICQLSLQKQYNKKIRKIGIIFNLDEHDESGSHWVSLFIDLDEHFIFYFDSTGERIPKEIDILVERIQKQGEKLFPKPIHFRYIYSDIEHQQENTECGMYSLFFLITMLTRDIDGKKIESTKELLNTFTGKSKREKRNGKKIEMGGISDNLDLENNQNKNRILDEEMEKYRSSYFTPI
jgi:hypothetical protein